MIKITVEEARKVVECLQAMQRQATNWSEIMFKEGGVEEATFKLGKMEKAFFKLGEAQGLARAEKALIQVIERAIAEREAQLLEDDHYEEHGYPCASYGSFPSEGKPYFALRDGMLVPDNDGGGQ